MMVHSLQPLTIILMVMFLSFTHVHAKGFPAKSGILPWVDVHTSKDVYNITSSRGDTWNLVFSDEFEVPGRDFAPGNDYLWTALELPDGVNAALEYYSINTTSTTTEPDGRGVFQIEVRQEPNITFSVFNAYKRPPAFEDYTMYYRAGMVQSWNKFCFQGGYVDVSVQLPGAISASSGNPDLGNPKNRVTHGEYYPTWPGIWFLGNLGRALFTGSTNRMWPWSYNECNPELDKNQRISACNDNPGFGLNKNQGRGAPEIDLLEGGGLDVSTSIQVAPGMPSQYRLFPAQNDSNMFCFYNGGCNTIGANYPGIPSAVYAKRGYKSWYQGLRYAPNTYCTVDGSLKQDPAVVIANLKKGISDNQCKGVNTCPASKDGYSDVSLIDGKGPGYWGVNGVGGCMPVINGYQGSYLCDPDNSNTQCASPLRDGNTKTNVMASFNYQMDALSANSGLPLQAYTGYLNYQLEWVMGDEGYIRWMIQGIPVYEIPSQALTNPPQDANNSNPKKLMIEEPMYIIFNVALSTSWGTRPPNPGKPCKGDGKDPTVNRICNDFPMYMKIDYIRIYQDTSNTSSMAIGCDPSTHPTKEWIQGHVEEYEDPKNKVIEVIGGAPCFSDADCTVTSVAIASIVTGKCNKQGKCTCLQASWGGPRCTTATNEVGEGPSKGYGPSVEVAISFGAIACVILCIVVYKIVQKRIRTRLEHAFVQKTTVVGEIPLEEMGQSRSRDERAA